MLPDSGGGWMLLSIVGFLVILGPLVIFHEFGHYIFARIFNVKAEAFSIGFGPKLWKKQMGETELRISAIPLGGYVKLLGEDRESQLSPEEQKRALHRQAPWKRFFIFFGGPLFNFLLAIFIFMAILAIGEPQIGNLIGRVVKNSPAARDGFRSGDLVLQVDGKPVKLFEDFMNVVGDNPGKPVHFQVLHAGQTQPTDLTVIPESTDGYSLYGEATHIGDIDGIYPSPRVAEVGIPNPQSLAGKAGFKTGDVITELNGSPMKSWEDLQSIFEKSAAGTNFSFKVERSPEDAKSSAASPSTFTVSLVKPADATSLDSAWGLYSSELFVAKTVPKSPADVAGLKAGDRIVSVSGKPIESFFDLKDEVQNAGEKDGKVQVKWERAGKFMDATITPTETTTRNALLKVAKNYTIGIMPMLVMADPQMVIERIWNPFKLLWKGSERMVVFSWRNLVSIQKMFTGDVSTATLGGPIMIGKIAGESLSRGLIAFLNLMAILSIGLGVLNILPVPVLDGGHLLLLCIESIRGKPLAMRTMEIVQGGGLIALLMLMVIVFKNDFVRLSLFN
jgi:regulator of sigma E protease